MREERDPLARGQIVAAAQRIEELEGPQLQGLTRTPLGVDQGSLVCWSCGEAGHRKQNCPKKGAGQPGKAVKFQPGKT